MILLLAPLAVIALGYRQLSAAMGRQAASGLVLVVAGVGTAVWMLDNVTW